MAYPQYTPKAASICSPVSILHPSPRQGHSGYLQVLALNTGFTTSKPTHTRSVAAMAFLAGPHGAAIERILGRYPHLGWHSAVMGERISSRTGARVLVYHIGADELDHRDWFWLFLELRRYVRCCWPYGEFRIEASVADVDSFVRDHRRGLMEEFPSMEHWGEVVHAGPRVNSEAVREDGNVDRNAEKPASTKTMAAAKEGARDQAPGRKSQESKKEEAERKIQHKREQQQARQEHDPRDYGQIEIEEVAAEPELRAAAVVEEATLQLQQQQQREEQTSADGQEEAHEQVERRVPLLRRVCSRERRKSLKNGILGVKRKLSWLGFGSLGRPRACPAEC